MYKIILNTYLKLETNNKRIVMSKTTIKKLLQSMTKDEIIGMVLELYSAKKEAWNTMPVLTRKENSKSTRTSFVRNFIL